MIAAHVRTRFERLSGLLRICRELRSALESGAGESLARLACERAAALHELADAMPMGAVAAESWASEPGEATEARIAVAWLVAAILREEEAIDSQPAAITRNILSLHAHARSSKLASAPPEQWLVRGFLPDAPLAVSVPHGGRFL